MSDDLRPGQIPSLTSAQRAAASIVRQTTLRRHVIIFSVTRAGPFLVLVFAAWVLLGFDGSRMSLHGWIAMVLGIILTGGLAIALMAAVFTSDSSGQDALAVGRTGASE